MQVQTINNKNYHTIFNANLCIGGDVKSIPQKFIVSWTYKLESLGNESDAVILHVGAKENFLSPSYLFGLIPKQIIKKSRYIFAVANINGVNCDKNLSYACKDKKFNVDNYFLLRNPFGI